MKQRLAAILSADAAGYSRLMSQDEHVTVAALDAAREVFKAKVESRQGRIVDMAGDSVLALFDTAAGAVGAALAVQTELAAVFADVPEDRRMRIRIGVHLGDAIEKPDGTVYGDGVNIAARLQALAEPGRHRGVGCRSRQGRGGFRRPRRAIGEEHRRARAPVRLVRRSFRARGAAAPGP